MTSIFGFVLLDDAAQILFVLKYDSSSCDTTFAKLKFRLTKHRTVSPTFW